MLIPQPQRPLARLGRFSPCIDATSPKPAKLTLVDILFDGVVLRNVVDMKAAIALLLARKAIVYLHLFTFDSGDNSSVLVKRCCCAVALCVFSMAFTQTLETS